MRKQLEDSQSQVNERARAESKTEILSKQVEELTHKLKSESDTVTKLRKAQQQLNKVGTTILVLFIALYWHDLLCTEWRYCGEILCTVQWLP